MGTTRTVIQPQFSLNKARLLATISATFFLAAASGGCIVGQPPGKGKCLRLREATTGAAYWLYLPASYEESSATGSAPTKHPLVMTFHGMKPFDNDRSQIREWQQEADRYGYVVCAPALSVSAFFSPLPLNDPENVNLKRDERNIVAIMNELYKTVDVDPNLVLSTGWSYGGYVAHYMANRYPERFRCIVVKQCNFSSELLNPANVPKYRDHKVGIFYTENDFALCQKESRLAARWYAGHGFDLTYAVFEQKGHERTPGVAAEFFARVSGLEAKTPPIELAQMQVVQVAPPMEPEPGSLTGVARGNRGRTNSVPTIRRPGDPIGSPAITAPRGRAAPLRTTPLQPFPNTAPTPRRTVDSRRPIQDGPIRILLSPTIGVHPLLVSYSATMPKHIRRGSDLLWTHNGRPISNQLNGQKVFSTPGQHELALLVTTPEGIEYRASKKLTVTDRSSGRRDR